MLKMMRFGEIIVKKIKNSKNSNFINFNIKFIFYIKNHGNGKTSDFQNSSSLYPNFGTQSTIRGVPVQAYYAYKHMIPAGQVYLIPDSNNLKNSKNPKNSKKI